MLTGGASSTGGSTEVLVVVDVTGTEVDGTVSGTEVVDSGGSVVQVGCSGWNSHFHAPATPPERARNPSDRAARMDRAMIFRRMP